MALYVLPAIASTITNNNDNMGSSASKTTNANAADNISIDKSDQGGLHILEFHLPSAGMGAGIFFLVLAILLLVCVARKYRLCRKLRPERNTALPYVVPAAPQPLQPLVIQTQAPQAALSPPIPSVYPSAPPLPPSMQKWAQ